MHNKIKFLACFQKIWQSFHVHILLLSHLNNNKIFFFKSYLWQWLLPNIHVLPRHLSLLLGWMTSFGGWAFNKVTWITPRLRKLEAALPPPIFFCKWWTWRRCVKYSTTLKWMRGACLHQNLHKGHKWQSVTILACWNYCVC